MAGFVRVCPAPLVWFHAVCSQLRCSPISARLPLSPPQQILSQPPDASSAVRHVPVARNSVLPREKTSDWDKPLLPLSQEKG